MYPSDAYVESQIVKRLADYHEYSFFGIPVGFFRNCMKHGLSKAVQEDVGLTMFVHSSVVRGYRKMWVLDEKDHYRDVKMGLRKGGRRLMSPVQFELERREILRREAEKPSMSHNS